MRQANVTDYEEFAREIIAIIPDRPISFEVIANDMREIENQARFINTWGENVYVKIPVMNTRRESAAVLVRRLSLDGIKVNVTAVFTPAQIREAIEALAGGAPAYISIFAGRIADTGVDPMPIIRDASGMLDGQRQISLIWASVREVFNVFQADSVGCDAITVTPDILRKLSLVGRDLTEYSLQTVQMFAHDSDKSGLTIQIPNFSSPGVTAAAKR
jgi:transaldolase